MRVLITGGSGYLGQFILETLQKTLQKDCTVAYTYLANSIAGLQLPVQSFKVDLATGEGVQAAVLEFQPQVVINCAAISQPAACERDYEACTAVNVPKHLVEALHQLQHQHGLTALLIHISTDQVYDGSKSFWCESDPTQPVNAYGRSKLEAEQYLQKFWTGRFIVLRSSLIYGPPPPLQSVGRPLFVQFVEQVLANKQETSFFVDEYRSAVFVYDICNVIKHVINRYTPSAQTTAPPQDQQQSSSSAIPEQPSPPAAAAAAAGGVQASHPCVLADFPHSIYNMGGPERLSRLDMAAAVAAHCGHSTAAIKAVKSADIPRGYCSPLDISMNINHLLTDMPDIKLTSFKEGLQRIFPGAQSDTR